jgi:hypothetical protein
LEEFVGLLDRSDVSIAAYFRHPVAGYHGLAMAVTLLEGAVTGRGTTRGRHWPVVTWLRPIFAIIGFAALAFGLTHLFRKFSK